MGTVTFHRVRFTEEEITLRDEDGQAFDTVDIPHDDEHTHTSVHDELTAREAVDLIRREGLTFEGSDWAYHPDGSQIIDYAEGLREETTAHLSDFHPRVINAIITTIG